MKSIIRLFIFQSLLLIVLDATSMAIVPTDSIWFERRVKLADNPVFSITQDDDGFIWLGTKLGLYRYNGINLRFFPTKLDDSSPNGSSWIWTVHASRDGQVWAGTAEGLLRKNEYCSCFKQVVLSDANGKQAPISIRKIYEDSFGNLWFGTSSGVYVFDYRESKISKYSLSYELDQIAEYKIYEITEIQDGQILLAFSDGIKTVSNIISLDKNIPLLPIPKIKSFEGVRSMMYMPAEERLWVGSQSDQQGLIEYAIKENEIFEQELYGIPETNSIRVIRDFGDGSIWLGTMNGIVRFDPKKQTNMKYLENLSIRDLYKDKTGGIWVATYNDGIYYYHPRANKFDHIFKHMTFSKRGSNQIDRRSEFVTSFAPMDTMNLWIGSDYGLRLYDNQSSTYQSSITDSVNSQLSNIRIKSLQASQGQLYIGTFGGLSVLNLATMNVQNIKLTEDPENQQWNDILDIEVSNGKVFLGSNGGGLYLLKKGKLRQFSNKFNDKANQINGLYTHRDRLWIGSNAGLCSIDTTTRTFKKFSNGENYLFPEINIVSIARDKQDMLWLGTERSGLIYFDPKTEEYMMVNETNGLQSSYIKSMFIDKHNALWTSTDSELYQIIPSSISAFEVFNHSIETDWGTPSFSVSSAIITSEDIAHFGTRHGFIKFDIDAIKAVRKHPPVIISDIEVNQESLLNASFNSEEHLPNLEHLELQHNQSTLAIEFSSHDFNTLNGYYYAYLLEGVDDQWNKIGKKNRISFNYLPPGDYTLKLKASNSFNDWGNEYSTFEFTILPPFYKSPVAFVCYALLIFLLLYLYYYQSSKWNEMRTALSLEEINNKKEYEVHQMKSEFFLNISHELKTPLALITLPLKDLLKQKIESASVRNRLVTIKRNAERIEKLVNQIVEVKKLETSVGNLSVWSMDLNLFMKQVGKDFNELARLKNINYEIRTHNDLPNIWFDPQKMEVVLTNILSNSFKDTGENGRITLGARAKTNGDEEKRVEIFVEDSGTGIAKEDIPYLFDRFKKISRKDRGMSLGDGIGLDLAQKIIKLHKGKIEVESIPQSSDGRGLTKFSIELHADNPFEKEQVNEGNYAVKKEETELDIHEEYQLIKTKEYEEMIDQSILIIEADTSIRSQLGLAFFDFTQVYEASDGMEGWKLTLDMLPTAIICSRELPTLDGKDLCKRIKEDDRTCHIPVVMLAEDLSEENFADETTSLPLNLNHIRKRIDYLIEQRERIRNQIEKQTILKPQVLSSYDEVMLDKVVAYIEKHIADPGLSVANVSHEVGLSRTHFYRKIKALMNMAPNTFIRTYRIRKAAQLLKQNKQNISDVRLMVGFSDADYFRSCFKKEFGETPSEYMKGSS